MLDGKEPNNLRVIPENAGMLQCIEDSLLNVVTITTSIIGRCDVYADCDWPHQRLDTFGNCYAAHLMTIRASILRQDRSPLVVAEKVINAWWKREFEFKWHG
jgi:hypothetical protein